MTIDNILVATDFGDASMEALSWAFRIAEPLGAKVGGLGATSELLGGRAESILRNARCPVVVVRPAELNLLAIAAEHRRGLS